MPNLVDADSDHDSPAAPADDSRPGLSAVDRKRSELAMRSMKMMLSIPHNLGRAALRRVRPKTDHRIFAFLDECCNSSCHPRPWMEDGAEKACNSAHSKVPQKLAMELEELQP